MGFQRMNNDEGTEGWTDISARDADQYIDYGEDHEWTNGYDTLIEYLKVSELNKLIYKK